LAFVLNRCDDLGQTCEVDYREHAPPPALAGLIKCFWTLDGGGSAGAWIEQQATPDGCVEVIRRLAGQSRWDGDQPESFAVGLVGAPAGFAISGDTRFAAIRLWPWAWELVAGISPAGMWGRWVPFAHPLVEALPDFEVAARRFPSDEALNAIGAALVGAGSVQAMGRAAGMGPRRLQRWFARNVGVPPRHYLRLRRFQKAFEQVPGAASLADHAAAQGFADQAHMAREFREMAGVPATEARRTARGPFLT
jgi:AraC-like DNA-binding protein